MSDTPETEVGRAEHGRVARAALVIVGGLFFLFSIGLLVLLAVRTFVGYRDKVPEPPNAIAGWFAVLAIFLPIAAYGAVLVRRGLRGFSTTGENERRLAARLAPLWEGPLLPSLVCAGVLTLLANWVAPTEARYLIRQQSPALQFLAFAGLPFVTLHLYVAIHELAHAIAARLLGFPFQRLQLGPLVWARVDGRIRVTWRPADVARLLGMHEVPTGVPLLGPRFALWALAGPAATLLGAGACAWLSWSVQFETPLPTAVLRVAMRGSSAVGLVLAITSLVPWALDNREASDGLLARMALRPSKFTRLAEAFISNNQRGTRPREWLETADEFFEAARWDTPMRPLFMLGGLQIACDLRDHDRVETVLEQIHEDLGLILSPMAFQFHAITSLVVAQFGDAVQARDQLLCARECDTSDLLLLVEAGVHLAEGHPQEARLAFERWERALAARPDGMAFRVGFEWAEEMLRERLAQAPPSPTQDGKTSAGAP